MPLARWDPGGREAIARGSRHPCRHIITAARARQRHRQQPQPGAPVRTALRRRDHTLRQARPGLRLSVARRARVAAAAAATAAAARPAPPRRALPPPPRVWPHCLSPAAEPPIVLLQLTARWCPRAARLLPRFSAHTSASQLRLAHALLPCPTHSPVLPLAAPHVATLGSRAPQIRLPFDRLACLLRLRNTARRCSALCEYCDSPSSSTSDFPSARLHFHKPPSVHHLASLHPTASSASSARYIEPVIAT